MPRLRRLALLCIPLAVTALTQALPGRAQQPLSSRYAFADTTLLRDTLGLSFAGLFPVADSLQLAPDTVRALMIRYQLPWQRLLGMADSMAVPFDSVGPRITRERFNPLVGTRRRRANDFHYTSGFTVAQTSSVWSNQSDYHGLRGPVYANNSTAVTLERHLNGGSTSLRQTRDATSEIGFRPSNSRSLGSLLHLSRYDSADPGGLNRQQETLNEYKFTAHTRSEHLKTMNATLDAQAGYLSDERLAIDVKHGLSGRIDGRLRNTPGPWLTHDLSVGLSSALARTRRPETLRELRALDFASNVTGTLNLFANAPASLNVNYNSRRSRVDTPLDTVRINHIRNTASGLDATLRLRRDSDHTLNLNGSLAQSGTTVGTRLDGGGKAIARWELLGWAADANYSDQRSRSNNPRHNGGYGYDENDVIRAAGVTLSRSLGPRLVGKLTTSISLNRYRYTATADSALPPPPRDSYRQSYRLDGQYTQSQRFNTGASFEASLSRAINIDANTAGTNSDTRSYRADWRWSYRLLPGLTVTQANAMSADYQFYTFSPVRNTLSLSYSTSTTLSATVTPRMTVDLQHLATTQPRGGYVAGPDGVESLKLSDESKNYSLRSSISYSPTPGLAIQIRPSYQTSQSSGSTNGVTALQRQDKFLNMSGGVSLNVPISARGTLTGNIARNYLGQRTASYQNGGVQLSPRSESDYWNGSLQLTWQP